MASEKLEVLLHELAQSRRRAIRELIEEAFKEDEAYLVQMVRYLFDLSQMVNKPTREDLSTSNWIKIDSLSKLRQIVGGRFGNLKDMWIQCGFPVKKKKGMKLGNYTISKEGWNKLARWLETRGYEGKLVKPNEEYLFEVRKVKIFQEVD